MNEMMSLQQALKMKVAGISIKIQMICQASVESTNNDEQLAVAGCVKLP